MTQAELWGTSLPLNYGLTYAEHALNLYPVLSSGVRMPGGQWPLSSENGLSGSVEYQKYTVVVAFVSLPNLGNYIFDKYARKG